jgi:PPP family 3-phenylpropionic acid transporter
MLVDLQGPQAVLPSLFAIYGVIWLASLVISDPDPEPHPEHQPPIFAVIRQPAILAFFMACFLLQAGHGV